MPNYSNLLAWQKGFVVAKRIYKLTSNFPKEQQYRLCDQMERASVSIISNIAEGSRRTNKEWINYLRISLGSASELESQLLLAKELYPAPLEEFNSLLSEVDQIAKLLNSYIKRQTQS